jgi:hypothetical protein
MKALPDDPLEPMLLQLLQELRSLKEQHDRTAHQHHQEQQQFQAELQRLEQHQQELLDILQTIQAESPQTVDHLQNQQQHNQEAQNQLTAIRKNQIATFDEMSSLGKWLRDKLPTLKGDPEDGRPALHLFDDSGPLLWIKVGLGFLVLTLIANAVLQYLPGGANERMKLMDEKIFLIWRDQKNTQKFLGMPQKK